MGVEYIKTVVDVSYDNVMSFKDPRGFYFKKNIKAA